MSQTGRETFRLCAGGERETDLIKGKGVVGEKEGGEARISTKEEATTTPEKKETGES